MREVKKILNGWLILLTLTALANIPISTAQARINKEVVLYTEDETGLLLTEDEDLGDTSGNAEDSDVVVLPELSSEDSGHSTVNNISLGDFIVDERQMLYQTRMVDAEFLDAPVIEVLRGLAEAADINYVLPKLDSKTISIRLRMPAFKALELIADDQGMEVVKEKDLWFIRKKDKEALVARVYKLKHIHLGLSGGGNAAGNNDDNRTFGSASYSDIGGDTNNNNNNSNSYNSNNNNNNRSTGSENQTGERLSQVDSTSNFTTLGDVRNRLQQSSDVLDTIREILGIAERNKLTSQENKEGDRRTDEQNKNESFVSYNAESNTLYVIATEHQQYWVQKYLDVVDKAINNIAIDAIFLESDLNPTESLGVSWENVASGYTFRAGQGSSAGSLAYNVLENPVLPTGVILESDALEATVRAWIAENKSRVARYPRVVTANNQQVKIQTTTNIPVISDVSTTSTAGTTDTTSTTVTGDTTQTNFTASTQSIGTIINIIPQQVNDDIILLKIGIEISAADSATSGETRTGRVTTNATLYEGEVRVPSGKTLAIGGLERIAESSNIRRIPWISEIPLFGFLFKDKSKDFRRTNITLLLTPTILPEMEAKALMPSQFRDTRDERIMEDLDAVETQSVDKDRIYRKR